MRALCAHACFLCGLMRALCAHAALFLLNARFVRSWLYQVHCKAKGVPRTKPGLQVQASGIDTPNRSKTNSVPRTKLALQVQTSGMGKPNRNNTSALHEPIIPTPHMTEEPKH